ncbi:MAG: alpha/beta hydrolase [Rhodospirillales bacterium]
MTALRDPSWIRRQYRDIAYAGASAAQRLDLYLPNDGAAPYKVIVAIHGGGFVIGDKGDDQLNGPVEAVREGYAVAAVNYRMADEALFPAALQDVKAAIRFLRAQAAAYDLDAGRIAAWGNSAGGYLAVMAGVAADEREFDDASLGNAALSSRVQAVIDWFGPIEFVSMDAQLRASGKGPPNHGEANSPESRFLGARLADVEAALLHKANPLSYLAPGLPPFLIQHGSDDDLVPIEQSVLLADRLRAVLPVGDVRLDILAGSLHGGAAFEQPENMAKVFDFLARTIGK